MLPDRICVLSDRVGKRECHGVDSGWICISFGMSKLPDDGVSGTHFSLCLCDVYFERQYAVKGDTKVCQIVTVC